MEFSRSFQSYIKGGPFPLESVIQPMGFHNLTMHYYSYNHNGFGNNPSNCSLTFDQSNNGSLISLNDVNNARNNLVASIGSFDNNVNLLFYNNNQQSMEGVDNQFMIGQTHANNVYPQIYSSANQMEFCRPFLPSNNFSSIVEKNSNSLFDRNVNINGNFVQMEETSADQANTRIVLKGQWTAEEDQMLVHLVNLYGVKKWSHIAQMVGFRIGKQCRERWFNHLRPDIKKDPWSEEEDRVLIRTHSELGNKWSKIAKLLPGRTENSIKNRWNTNIRKQLPRSTNNARRRRYPKSGGSLIQNYMQSLAQCSPAPAIPKKKKKKHIRPSLSSNINNFTSHGISAADGNVNMPEMYNVAQHFQQQGYDHGASSSKSYSGIDMRMDWSGAMPSLMMFENEKREMNLPEMTVLNNSFIF